MRFDYITICHNKLLKDLPERTEDVISRRFGLEGKIETLESIGRAYGITRERVRQIEEDGLRRLKEKTKEPVCQNVFQYFTQELKKAGNLKREDLLLNHLGGESFQNHVFFMLTLAEDFERVKETEDFYAFWTIDSNSLKVAKKAIDSFLPVLKRKKEPLLLPKNFPPAYVEISKNILKGQDGLYGLRDWPEINPRGVKDRAYLVFKKQRRPLHFSEVASLMTKLTEKPAIAQTVHNELIRDPRFVLVGRGLYALAEWGYAPGVVKEVISRVLEESRRPLAKKEIVRQVLKQRYVKANTVLLNLQNKRYFLKNPDGKYTIKKA